MRQTKLGCFVEKFPRKTAAIFQIKPEVLDIQFQVLGTRRFFSA